MEFNDTAGGRLAIPRKLLTEALWAEAILRYADDLVVGFQHRTDAERFLGEFKDRLAKFDLELHPDKTRLIEFGRYAARDRKQRGEGKPETFTFLGFTHFCGQRHKKGTFTVWRITAKKRMVAKLKAIKVELQRRMHDRVPEVGAWLRKVVSGYSQYHAVPGNIDRLRIFGRRVNPTVAQRSGSPQPNREEEVGATYPCLGKVDSTAPSPTPLSGGALLRHSSFVRAVCVDALARIYAGGWPVKAVPTATGTRISNKRSQQSRIP